MSHVKIKKKIKASLFKFITRFNQHHSRNETLVLSDIKKILIIRQDNRIGNILFTTSLIELINQQTDICPDIIVGEKFHALLRNNQSIGTIYVYKQKQFVKYPWRFLTFMKTLKGMEYDLVIDCKSSFSFNNALLTVFSNAKQKIGFFNSQSHLYLDYSLELTNNDSIHESIYIAQPFIRYFSLNCEVPTMKYSFVNDQEMQAFKSDSLTVGIHIGGRHEKSISPDLVNQICAELQTGNTDILIIYGPDEVEKARLIIDRENMQKVFPASMDQLAQAINSADVFITPDTGPLHIASALNKRIIAMFNTKNWKRYGPRSQQPSLTIHTREFSTQEIVNKIRLYLWP